MSLCRLMQMDFQFGTGDTDPVLKERLYTEYDLLYGIGFATDYLNIGVRREPLYGYSLWRFRAWCRKKLAALERRAGPDGKPK